MLRAVAVVIGTLVVPALVWAAATSGRWSVARFAVVDPLLVAGFCFALAWALGEPLGTAVSALRSAAARVPDKVFVGLACGWIATASAIVSRYVFAGQPVLSDELSQQFQGRILLSGRLVAKAERAGEFFETAQTLTRGDAWFSEFPIGGGMLAALGDLIRMPWLINPVLIAFAAAGLFHFARRVYDTGTARVAVVLMCLSPFVVFTSASRMNHVPTLTLLMVALLALARWSEATESEPTTRRNSGVAIGAAIGAIVLFRPFDALLVAIPFAIFQLRAVSREPRRTGSLVAQVLAGTLVVSIQLIVNWKTTGAPLLFGYDALNGTQHRPGFHVDPFGRDFGPFAGAYRVVLYYSRLDVTLFESVIPGLFFVVAGMWWASEGSRWDALLAGILSSLTVGYWMYWFDGNFIGPRFLYLATPTLLIFAARFAVKAARGSESSPAARALVLMLPVCLVLALLPPAIGNRSTGIPLRLSGMLRDPFARSPDPAAEVTKAGLTNALVFVREPFHATLAARLRGLGMRPYDAERAAADLDACALLDGLTAADSSSASPDVKLAAVIQRARQAGPAEPVRGRIGTESLALANGVVSTPACAAEVARDSSGTESYDRFLAVSTFDSAGRLGGPVVFARELGARDRLLAGERFGPRRWYRYSRDRTTGDVRFIPYAADSIR